MGHPSTHFFFWKEKTWFSNHPNLQWGHFFPAVKKLQGCSTLEDFLRGKWLGSPRIKKKHKFMAILEGRGPTKNVTSMDFPRSETETVRKWGHCVARRVDPWLLGLRGRLGSATFLYVLLGLSYPSCFKVWWICRIRSLYWLHRHCVVLAFLVYICFYIIYMF